MISLPLTCDCSHSFKIDPMGVTTKTEIVCPACQKIDHLDDALVTSIADQYNEAIGEMFDDDETYDRYAAAWDDAPFKERAKVVDDGF